MLTSRSWKSVFGFVLLLGFALAPTPAGAEERGARVELTSEQQAAARSYWTSARMKAAAPGDRLLLGRKLSAATSEVGRGAAKVVEGIAAPATKALGLDGLLGGLRGGGRGAVYAGGGDVVLTSGKVFFTLDGTDYVCSGSSTMASNRSLVQTAGHCVNEGPGAFATNFVFVPAYRDGQAPYGRFAAASLLTTNQWRQDGDLSYDVGYAIVGQVSGKALADTVGAQGIGFNLVRGGTMHAFGYPAAAPYDGSKLAWCRGAVTNDTRGTSDQGMRCNMTGGSSGGPWFASFDELSGVGTLNSLNSFKYSTLGLINGDKMFGPYFGSVIQALYETAAR